VLVVDDEPTYRRGLRSLLEASSDQVVIVGEAANREAAIEEAKRSHPDVVLLDLQLPTRPGLYQRPLVENGLEAIKVIRKEAPETSILVLSHSLEPSALFQAFRAGALGYVAKPNVQDARDLVEPILSVRAGRAFFSPAIAELIQRFFALGMGPEPTHEELDQLEQVTNSGPGAAVGTIVEKIRSSDTSAPELFSKPDPAQEEEAGAEIFVSYSHADEHFKDELLNHLSILKRLGVIRDWHDRRIGAGTEWKSAIDQHLDSADVVLLLVSANFLASDYCWSLEMKTALSRHDAGRARVIPVILRSCDWHEAPLGRLQALPKDGRPIASWNDRDAAFTDVAHGVRTAVGALQPRRSSVRSSG
jgi:DNA-binding NarL/FixJ family response regulator